MDREIPGFNLIVVQAQAAASMADRAKTGHANSKQTLYHLIGISAYIKEVSERMLTDLEEGRL